jgi:hypothetical protein
MGKRLVSTGSFVAIDFDGERHRIKVLSEFEDVVAVGHCRSLAGKHTVHTSSS